MVNYNRLRINVTFVPWFFLDSEDSVDQISIEPPYALTKFLIKGMPNPVPLSPLVPIRLRPFSFSSFGFYVDNTGAYVL